MSDASGTPPVASPPPKRVLARATPWRRHGGLRRAHVDAAVRDRDRRAVDPRRDVDGARRGDRRLADAEAEDAQDAVGEVEVAGLVAAELAVLGLEERQHVVLDRRRPGS